MKWLLVFWFEAHGWNISLPVLKYDVEGQCEEAGREMVARNRQSHASYGCFEAR